MEELRQIADALVAPGKGILASDESPGTLGKRLAKSGIDNSEENRRAYRDLFYTAPGLGDAIAGAILHPEALAQATSDGVPFVDALAALGVRTGVKVDLGLAPLDGAGAGETETLGLEGLEARCREYHARGARFSKWRAALRCGGGLPSDAAVEANAEQLAAYAAASQRAGLVPIVEPEILIEGSFSADEAEAALVRVLARLAAALALHGVDTEAALLKIQMVIPGADFPGPRPAPAEVAARTLRALGAPPPAPPRPIRVVFLSGGLSEEDATLYLDAINRAAAAAGPSPHAVALSFSFGRALQASVLQLWAADRGDVARCRAMAAALAAANGRAARGQWEGPHPSLLAGASLSLVEDFRGWGHIK